MFTISVVLLSHLILVSSSSLTECGIRVRLTPPSPCKLGSKLQLSFHSHGSSHTQLIHTQSIHTQLIHTQSLSWCSEGLIYPNNVLLPQRDEGSAKPCESMEPHRILEPTRIRTQNFWVFKAIVVVSLFYHCTFFQCDLWDTKYFIELNFRKFILFQLASRLQFD